MSEDIDFLKLWNYFCYQVEKLQKCNEQFFQIVAENLFERFGWEQCNDEIVSQQTIHIGSAQSLKPDIIVQSDGRRHFVVELKRAGAGLNDQNRQQLFSYMRQLKLRFGILIGNSVQVFYEIENDDCDPRCVADIKFCKDNPCGVEFVRVIAKDGYTFKRFQDYCERELEKANERDQIETEVNNICTNQGATFVKDLVKMELIKTYSPCAADAILDGINISITKKVPFVEGGQAHAQRPGSERTTCARTTDVRANAGGGDLEIQKAYENYLVSTGKRLNTVSSYVSALRRVLYAEKLAWCDLRDHIGRLVIEYATTKAQDDHNATISALRRYKESLS